MKWMFPLVTLGLAGCSAPPPPQVVGSAKDPVTLVKNDDARMNDAIAQARRELPTFKRYLAMPPSKNRFLEFKAKFSEGAASEHMWITHPAWNSKKQTFSGTLANTPDIVKGPKLGQKVTVPERDLSDWVVEFAPAEKGGKVSAIGGYTMRVLMQMEDEAHAANAKTGAKR